MGTIHLSSEEVRAKVTSLVPLLLAVLLTASGLTVLTAGKADAAVVSYRTTTDVSARSTPTAAPTGIYGIPAGAYFGVECQIIGQPVGPYGNTLYFWTIYGGRGMYVPDTYTNSPHLAGQPPIAGIPMCGSAPAPAPSVPGATGQASYNVGTPCTGKYPISQATDPAYHNRPAGGDVAFDYFCLPGSGIRVHVAPIVPYVNPTLTVGSVRAACASGVIADGGYAVRVDVRANGTLIGHIWYLHISNPQVGAGQGIGEGTLLGWTSRFRSSSCYQVGVDAGVHTHMELYNQSRYACAVNLPFGTPMNEGRRIGSLGGSFATRTSAYCP